MRCLPECDLGFRHPRAGAKRRPGFTLVELLVVIAILGVLAGLLLPSFARSRLRAKVAVCANNYRQWGVAANAYASDDRGGRFPAFPLPISKMKGYGGLSPWFVAHEMVTNMGTYGIEVPLWFCPTRPGELRLHETMFKSVARGGSMATVADLSQAYRAQNPIFAGISHSWWVPRPLEETGTVFPPSGTSSSRVPEGWPTKPDDPMVSTQPIISDAYWTDWNETRTAVNIGAYGSMGHRLTVLSPVQSLNVGFGDGHVETRPAARLQWQLNNLGSTTYLY